MKGGVIVAGVMLVLLALFAGLALRPAADQWQVWFTLGLVVGIGGTLVGIGVTS